MNHEIGLFRASVRRSITAPNGAILGVEACQLGTEKDFFFKGRYFIDCTGHGTMAASAGAEFRMGREAQSEFGEWQAPERADNKTMGASLLFRASNLGRPTPFTPPPWAASFPDDDDLPFRHRDLVGNPEKLEASGDEIKGYWWLEYGGERHAIEDAEHINEELLRAMYGIWDHAKNTGDHGVAEHAITHITTIPGHRESRRLMGDYILTEADVLGGTRFPDAVAYGGWHTDLHPPGGIYL
ncbi:MAG: FAD-dependent oxidoreductase [Planctomycetes bacterium]|nr:FAD-dependent oxidoreductase [Planctomycetota bacterium]